ncbi:MAG: hypothetical protein M3126_02685, partial [Candidatus Eremiobacteraeota bacterium]|nr:hypothetical protein [Candidatus Eremiobacteraeota bacterium]
MKNFILRLLVAAVLAVVPCAAAAQVPVNGRPPELLDPGFQSNPDGAIAAARERVAAGDFEG